MSSAKILVKRLIQWVGEYCPAELYLDNSISKKALELYRFLVQQSRVLGCCTISNDALKAAIYIDDQRHIRRLLSELRLNDYIKIDWLQSGVREITPASIAKDFDSMVITFEHYRSFEKINLLRAVYMRRYQLMGEHEFTPQIDEQIHIAAAMGLRDYCNSVDDNFLQKEVEKRALELHRKGSIEKAAIGKMNKKYLADAIFLR